MAEIGKAMLVTINLDDPYTNGAMWEGPFLERPDYPPHAHPIARAWALWESIKDDWPEASATVIANDRACDLRAAYRVSAMLGTDYAEALRDVEAEKYSGAAKSHTISAKEREA